MQALLGESAKRNDQFVGFVKGVQVAMDTLEASRGSNEKNYHLVKFLMAVHGQWVGSVRPRSDSPRTHGRSCRMGVLRDLENSEM